jgi:hypothetical protein
LHDFGFRREVYENCALLGYYTASSGSYLSIFVDISPEESSSHHIWHIFVEAIISVNIIELSPTKSVHHIGCLL